MKNEFFRRSLRLSAIIALLASTGCAEYHKRVLNHTEERGSEFTRTLADEYATLGEIELHIMYDEYSANYYFTKAICAKEGRNVGPTPLERWRLEEDKIPELAKARERLVLALDFGAREVAPKITAYTQAHFDCWVEQQAEGWQKDDIAACRSAYYQGMAEVESMLMGGLHNVRPAHMVFFHDNSSHLDAAAIAVVDEIAAAEKEMGYDQHILLVGRTDRKGDLTHNKNLSRHRAMAVKKELIRRGIPSHLIAIKAAGETPGPKVDAHNRRVDIIFLNYE